MAWFFLEHIGALFGQGGKTPNHSEVAVAACGLEGAPGGTGGHVRPGQELRLEIQENRTAVYRGKTLLGHLPEKESSQVAGLLEKGVDLGCRVVGSEGGNSRIRVRICIRM